jgi:tRNA1Val (adenine37-N6)-methyltransferase
LSSFRRIEEGAKRAASANADETLDSLFDGRIQLYQSRKGYRFSLDSVLLAHFARLRARDQAADLGTGNGAIALMLAYLHPGARITGIEIQPAMIERARRNVALNGLEERITIAHGDVRRPATLAARGSFDVVVCNPPYRSALSGRASPDPEKRLARHEFEGALRQFLRAAYELLGGRGKLALVYASFRSVDVLASMRAAGIEPKRLRAVHSSADGEASLLLLEGVKGAKSSLTIEAPLFVYEAQSRYSPEVTRMLKGDSKQFES